MVAAGRIPTLPPREPGEQRIVVHGVSWRDYLILRELLDSPGLRMAYCEGALELMSPSENHEMKKTFIARLLEVYALERDVSLLGCGSTTYRKEQAQRGLEPDECYFIEPRKGPYPDIAIEVVIESGGLDKLDIYRGLGVREVWFWKGGAFDLHELCAAGYERIARSRLVPDLDFDVLATFVRRDDQHQAVREFRDLVRGR